MLPADRRADAAGTTLRPTGPGGGDGVRDGAVDRRADEPGPLEPPEPLGPLVGRCGPSSHAGPGEKVLDTRGWAQFVSRLPGYDYWHVRQALTDSSLSYVLVGLDELKAPSARGETLRALLSFAGTRLVDFPASPDDPTPAVRIYRFHRPASWEGIAR